MNKIRRMTCLTMLLCPTLAIGSVRKPLNVILVMTDDQGYPDMARHGNPVIQTPHMDKLAESGVRFMDFHVNPFCSPTRAALLTGRMLDRTGVTSTNTHRNYLRREEVLMPEYFKASGYRTGLFGKWHVGANYPYRPIDRGFDEWLGLGNNGLATSADLWDNDRMNDTYWRTHWETLHLDRPLQRPVLSANVTLRLSPDITNSGNPITQQAVRQARPVNPIWLLQVERPGRFRFEVRRWPREVTAGLCEALPATTDPEIEYIGHKAYRIDVPGVALDIARVELMLNQEKLTKEVTHGAQGVSFDVDLPVGPVDVEAWFMGTGGKRMGAYFVYAEQLDN